MGPNALVLNPRQNGSQVKVPRFKTQHESIINTFKGNLKEMKISIQLISPFMIIMIII